MPTVVYSARESAFTNQRSAGGVPFTKTGTSYTVGYNDLAYFLFTGVNIPKGVNVTSATIGFSRNAVPVPASGLITLELHQEHGLTTIPATTWAPGELSWGYGPPTPVSIATTTRTNSDITAVIKRAVGTGFQSQWPESGSGSLLFSLDGLNEALEYMGTPGGSLTGYKVYPRTERHSTTAYRPLLTIIYEHRVNVNYTVTVDGLTATINDTSAHTNGNAITRTVDWGDGTVNSSLTHTYAQGGQYSITLTATSADGLSDWRVRSVTLNSAPTALAFITVDGLTATLTDQSTDPDGDALTRTVDWGDGTVDALLTHTYAQAGAYTVTLTVTDPRGGTSSIELGVVANNPPQAVFTYTTGTGNDSLRVEVNTKPSYDPDGDAITRTVDWGDGAPVDTTLRENLFDPSRVNNLAFSGSGSSITIITRSDYRGYALPVSPGQVYFFYRTGLTGRFRWTFTAAPPAVGVPNFNGQTTAAYDSTRSLFITVPPGASHILLYLSNAGEDVPNMLIERRDTEAAYFDGDTPSTDEVEYVWTGTPGASTSVALAGPVRTHTYRQAGTYLITVTVTDEHGATAEATAEVAVVAPVTFYLWDGDNELPLVTSLWDGAAEVPVTVNYTEE